LDKRSIAFFKTTCGQCFNDVEIPLLGDFSYGEFIFQTTDGQEFFVGVFIDNKTVDEVKSALKGETYDLYAIMTQLADKRNNKSFSTVYPICPNCKRKIRYYTDNDKTTEKEAHYVTWADFQSKNEDEKKEAVLELIKNN
jgi:hypothetical protein